MNGGGDIIRMSFVEWRYLTQVLCVTDQQTKRAAACLMHGTGLSFRGYKGAEYIAVKELQSLRERLISRDCK